MPGARERLGGVIRVHFYIMLSLRRWESTDIASLRHSLTTFLLRRCAVSICPLKYRCTSVAVVSITILQNTTTAADHRSLTLDY